MRRNAAIVAVCSLIVVLSGCKNTKKNTGAGAGAYDPYAYNSASTSTQYEPLTIPSYEQTPTYGTPATTDQGWGATTVSDSSSGARYHTVAKGDTLFSLSRKYYGDPGKWRDIYESNRTTLADPNKIRVGQRLLIP